MRTGEYIFTLKADGRTRTAHPVYGDGLSKTYEMDRERHFYRESLDGKLTFIGEDFDFIMETGFDSYVRVEVTRLGRSGVYFSGRFIRTDCEINLDRSQLTVELETDDQYNDLLENMGDEYDLLKQPLEVQPLSLVRRPILQVYIANDTVVSSFLGGMWEENECEATDDHEALGKYGFKSINNEFKCAASVTGTATPADIVGLYYGTRDISFTNVPALVYSENGKYFIRLDITPTTGGFAVACSLKDKDTGSDLFKNTNDTLIFEDWRSFEVELLAVDGSEASGTVRIGFQAIEMLQRALCNSDSIDGNPTMDVPEDDPFIKSDHYTRISEYPYDDCYLSVRFSSTPTEWGMASDGRYFLPPDDIYGYYPVSRNNWSQASIWYRYSANNISYDEKARTPFILKHAYPLHTCIQALLKLCAPDVTFEPTPDYSQFLYGDGDGVMDTSFRLYVTQKSNLLLGEYDRPAEKAMTTLESFLDMLKNCFRAFWFIDSQRRLRIEHVSWFMNGQTSGTQQIGVDLTAMICPSNGKPWSFGLNRYRYNRERMPQRYEFSWMDEVSDAFEGSPIEILSNFVEKGQVEDVQVGQFTTDVDYMLYASEEVSKDGFALLCAAVGGTGILVRAFRIGYGLGSRGEYVEEDGIASSSQFTPVVPAAEYVCSGSIRNIAFYSHGRTFISMASGASGAFAAPSGAEYIKVDFPAADVSSVWVKTKAAQPEVPFLEMQVGKYTYDMQNGMLSFSYLIPTFWTYDLPSRRVNINGEDTVLSHVGRELEQEVTCPAPEDPDVYGLVRTGIGTGQIQKASINMQSRMAEMTIIYDTEPEQ